MAFINEIYRYKKIFRDIEKATKKCVHLNGAIEYAYICENNSSISQSRVMEKFACTAKIINNNMS